MNTVTEKLFFGFIIFENKVKLSKNIRIKKSILIRFLILF